MISILYVSFSLLSLLWTLLWVWNKVWIEFWSFNTHGEICLIHTISIYSITLTGREIIQYVFTTQLITRNYFFIPALIWWAVALVWVSKKQITELVLFVLIVTLDGKCYYEIGRSSVKNCVGKWKTDFWSKKLELNEKWPEKTFHNISSWTNRNLKDYIIS